MTDKMREEFEKWYMTNTFAHIDHISVFYNDLNCYPAPIANHCWKAWQAAQSEQYAELERLREKAAEADELRKDAERYRWLRDDAFEHSDDCFMEAGRLFAEKHGVAFDYAVDAAIAGEKK